jgi:hypothetical protein
MNNLCPPRDLQRVSRCDRAGHGPGLSVIYSGHAGYANKQPPQEHARLCYLWRFAATRLLFHLTYRLNRHTDRLYRSDLEYFRTWLAEPDLASALATLFGNGHDAAKLLLQHHRDHLVATGHAVGTVNRHLCTIRKAVRIAREMGEIDWDLKDVPGIAICDNKPKTSSLGNDGAEGEEAQTRSHEIGLAQMIAEQREAK